MIIVEKRLHMYFIEFSLQAMAEMPAPGKVILLVEVNIKTRSSLPYFLASFSKTGVSMISSVRWWTMYASSQKILKSGAAVLSAAKRRIVSSL